MFRCAPISLLASARDCPAHARAKCISTTPKTVILSATHKTTILSATLKGNPSEPGLMAGHDTQTPTDRWQVLYRRTLAVAVVLALFLLAFALSRVVFLGIDGLIGVGEPGTVSRLLAGVLALQTVGFGVGALVILARRDDPRGYLRLGRVDQWTLFYGAAVGLALMLLVVSATGLFHLLDIEPAESAAGAATDPWFYAVLFVVSTVVVVPMEEVFFRGILQRRLEEVWHPAVAIGVASLLFMAIHTSVSVGSGGELLALALFFALGIALGVSYYLTENLLVPIIGHAVFNGSQIFVRLLEVSV